jgi:ribonucleoside-diphosphate reductase alpha chain
MEAACAGSAGVRPEALTQEVMKSVFDGISVGEIYRAMILAARCRIERDPAFDTVAARLLRMVISNEALGSSPHVNPAEYSKLYRNQFEHYVIDGINEDRLTPDLRNLNLTRIAGALQPERDGLFKYPGLQAVYDRYLLHIEGRRIETPQYFWMRVAMGLGDERRSAGRCGRSSFTISCRQCGSHPQRRPCLIRRPIIRSSVHVTCRP